jgi:hypothetical protein
MAIAATRFTFERHLDSIVPSDARRTCRCAVGLTAATMAIGSGILEAAVNDTDLTPRHWWYFPF